MPPELVIGSTSRLGEELAERFELIGREALAERGAFSLAVPGGSVATTFFPRLARAGLDWSRVDFFWADERAVAKDHADSNHAVARRLWLEPADVPAARIHRMPADDADLQRAAARYSAEITRVLGDAPALDLALLGMGEDGHVASLFPAHVLLGEEQLAVAAVEDAPKPPARRLTLTLPTLTRARLVVVVATGAAKAAAVRASLEDRDTALPVTLVVQRARRVVVLVDEDAASRLSGR
jgi:6-phosphogluconolactonase